MFRSCDRLPGEIFRMFFFINNLRLQADHPWFFAVATMMFLSAIKIVQSGSVRKCIPEVPCGLCRTASHCRVSWPEKLPPACVQDFYFLKIKPRLCGRFWSWGWFSSVYGNICVLVEHSANVYDQVFCLSGAIMFTLRLVVQPELIDSFSYLDGAVGAADNIASFR